MPIGLAADAERGDAAPREPLLYLELPSYLAFFQCH
jgi:hypothetical protein